ncbi:hypothetical protein [Bradyrhizobium genosp. P]|uniref:hypothetical protein n=1 Tax=Bradyrhizobium genosp. P TaxID=83641 RepID=UPI003CEB92FC
MPVRRGGAFNARLKLSYNKLTTNVPAENQQMVQCPTVVSHVGAGTLDCSINDTVVRSNLGPNFANVDRHDGNGVPYLIQKQLLASLEMDYDISDTIQLASNTGYYYADTAYVDTTNGAINPAQLLANYQALRDREFSQEFRVVTDFAGPLKLVAGAYYQHVNLYDVFIAAYNANAPITLFNNAGEASDTSCFARRTDAEVRHLFRICAGQLHAF